MLLVGCVVAFVVSLAAIRFLMDYVKRHNFKFFGVYRIVLGAHRTSSRGHHRAGIRENLIMITGDAALNAVQQPLIVWCASFLAG